MKAKTLVVAGLMAAFASVQVTQASLSISNGNFNIGYPGVSASIGGWASVTTNEFWQDGFWDAPGGEPIANLSIVPVGGAWIYQGIGTSDGAADLQISFDWIAFDGWEAGLSVSLYEDTVGTFAQADNVDVAGAGLTLVDSQNFQNINVYTTDVATFDLSGVGAGNNLYLRFNNYDSGNGQAWTGLDNIEIIPEPATIGLVGIFGAGVLFVRRRFII